MTKRKKEKNVKKRKTNVKNLNKISNKMLKDTFFLKQNKENKMSCCVFEEPPYNIKDARREITQDEVSKNISD